MKTTAKSALFRELPSVDEVVQIPGVEALAAGHGIAPVTDAARSVVARLRREIASGLLNQSALQLALTGIAAAIEGQLRHALGHSLRSVINATGVIQIGKASCRE